MAGPHVIPALPAMPLWIPPELDIEAVKTQVAAGGVSAGPADVPALRQVVADAEKDGIDLKIVVVDLKLPIDTPLRDIATVVGQANPGSTVLVMSPSVTGLPFAGTYSATVDRVTLEAGEDVAKTGNPVQSAQNFVSQLNTPLFPWTGLTIALTSAVLLAAILTRVMQVYSKRLCADENQAAVGHQRTSGNCPANGKNSH
jgi:hypothetical protein